MQTRPTSLSSPPLEAMEGQVVSRHLHFYCTSIRKPPGQNTNKREEESATGLPVRPDRVLSAFAFSGWPANTYPYRLGAKPHPLSLSLSFEVCPLSLLGQVSLALRCRTRQTQRTPLSADCMLSAAPASMPGKPHGIEPPTPPACLRWFWTILLYMHVRLTYSMKTFIHTYDAVYRKLL